MMGPTVLQARLSYTIYLGRQSGQTPMHVSSHLEKPQFIQKSKFHSHLARSITCRNTNTIQCEYAVVYIVNITLL